MDIQVVIGTEGYQKGLVMECTVEGQRGEPSHSSRRVFKFDKFVVKFDAVKNEDCEYRQNRLEVKNYNSLPDYERKYFAAILATGTVKRKFYIVQELVEHTDREVTQDEIEEFQVLRDKYSLWDVSVGKSYICNASLLPERGFKIYDIGVESMVKTNQPTLF